MAGSYFGENYLMVFQQKWDLCMSLVTVIMQKYHYFWKLYAWSSHDNLGILSENWNPESEAS
jgi:hypothetical protein